MSEENTNGTNGAAVNEDQELNETVTLVDSLGAAARDGKNATLAMLNTSDEDVAVIKAYVSRVNKLQAASGQIYKLRMAAAAKRNEGKTVPPSKRKKKTPPATT